MLSTIGITSAAGDISQKQVRSVYNSKFIFTSYASSRVSVCVVGQSMGETTRGAWKLLLHEAINESSS